MSKPDQDSQVGTVRDILAAYWRYIDNNYDASGVIEPVMSRAQAESAITELMDDQVGAVLDRLEKANDKEIRTYPDAVYRRHYGNVKKAIQTERNKLKGGDV